MAAAVFRAAGGSGLANRVLGGDWTHGQRNAGCIEAVTMLCPIAAKAVHVKASAGASSWSFPRPTRQASGSPARRRSLQPCPGSPASIAARCASPRSSMK
jgi:hypothetical protein